MEIITHILSMNCGLKQSDFEGMGWGCEVEVEVQDFTLQKKRRCVYHKQPENFID